ncbi:flagellar biosynthesis protein FliR [Falsiruegeria litorea R37]|uniref:Flagellar biosynthesis protein FliR n=1 Tax=Falsiruegeria litorea R37 TaxID=1200284 RepID=A0A1Y5TGU1_9RHOB|nr:flagellar biosynthetic protein FliR [Falsiruegeria litorea]SLN63706.1 flagellar biosynthesis protein FliR [Falsiruegeria litorea R37]
MSEPLAQYLSDEFWHFFTVLLRISAFVSVMPAFGERTVPVRVKMALAIAFTAIVAPALDQRFSPIDFAQFAQLAITEIMVGLILGLMIRLFVLGLQTAGSIAAQATSLSQILGGAAVEPVPAMGFLLVMAGLTLAVMTGLHVRAAEYAILSYTLFPAGSLPSAPDLTRWGVGQVATVFALAFSLAAPFVIASLIYNLAMGAINRAMPQLMVAFVGAPVITFGGLFILFAATPLLLTIWVDALNDFLMNPLGGPR